MRIRPKNHKKAFTLLELVVALVVLGILAALAVPTFASVIDNSANTRDATNLNAVASDAQAIATGKHESNSHSVDISAAVGESGKLPGDVTVSSVSSTLADPVPSTEYGVISYDNTDSPVKTGYAMKSSVGGCVMALTSGGSVDSWYYSASEDVSCDGSAALSGPGAPPVTTTTSGGGGTTLDAFVDSPVTIGSGTYPDGVALSPDGSLMAVANAGANTVSMFSVNATDGTVAPVPGSPFSVPGSGQPADVVFNQDGSLLAVPNFNQDGSVDMYTVNPSTGVLTLVSGSPFATGGGSQPATAYFSDDVSGHEFLVMPDFNLSKIDVFSVNPSTGVLTSAGSASTGSNTEPISAVISPAISGVQYVAAANANTANVSVFAMNATTGALTAVPGSPFAAGNAPFWTSFDVSGSSVYVAVSNQNYTNVSGDGTIDMYSMSTSTGALTPLSTPSYVVPGVLNLETDGFSPDGELLAVVGNSGIVGVPGDESYPGTSVTIYQVDPPSGDLTALAGSPFATGTGPDNLVWSADGSVLAIANWNDGSVTLYHVSPAA